MNNQATNSITHLLNDWKGDRPRALQELIEHAYEELSRQAHGMMRGERCSHTLQTRALVHETYLRLVELREIDWKGRRHFFAVASSIMRRILVDHARSYRALKRGGDAVRVTLDEFAENAPDMVDVLALDNALTCLAKHDATQARIVELRYFGGLTIAQAAENLQLSPATVKRKWGLAQAWLYREMHEVEDGGTSESH